MNNESHVPPSEASGPTPQRILSPLVTAQHRKRMILERRRQQREGSQALQLQRTASLPLQKEACLSSRFSTTSFSSLPPRKKSRSLPTLMENESTMSNSMFSFLHRKETDDTPTQMDASADSMFTPSFLKRKNAASDMSSPKKPSVVPKLSNYFSRTSQTDDEPTTTPKTKGQSTLFGAVMQRASTTPQLPTGVHLAVPDIHSTPLKSRSPSRFRMDVTPTSSRSKSFLAANSPGGFALLKVLDSVTSPFHLKQIKNENEDSVDSVPVEKSSRLEEWREATLDLSTRTVGVWDWSLKSKCRLECHPGSCVPGSLYNGDHAYVVQESIQKVMSGRWTEGSSSSQWEAARYYWQHPAMHPFPQMGEDDEDVLSQSTRVLSQSNKEASISMHKGVESSLASTLVDAVRGRDAILQRLVHHSHDTTLWKERRQREWQEAFRSLYFAWKNQMLNFQNALENGTIVSSKAIAESYFFCISPGQVVLFRIGIQKCNHRSSNDDSPNKQSSKILGTKTLRLVPMIILSSTTRQLRSQLNSMGATLYIHGKSGDEEFHEAFVDNSMTKESTEDESEQVREELEALRRAQAHGETAGADVTVSMTMKRGKKLNSPRNVSPLSLVGEDDCAAFFELYLNTLGTFQHTSWRKGNGDVPLLLCRKVGSFLHATLKSLTCLNRRDDSGMDEEKPQHATIELLGPILPCAMQDLICAASSRMMEDAVQNEPVADREDDEVGSHYFVVQAQLDNGKESPRTDSSSTGAAGSGWLNSGQSLPSGNRAIASNEIGTCERGEVVSMAVWDVARPHVIAYKTEAKSSVIF